jgi:hypothetical protein
MLATIQFRIFRLSVCIQQIYKSVILPVVLCVCVCKLGQKCRVREFENRILKRIFGPNKNEVTGERK